MKQVEQTAKASEPHLKSLVPTLLEEDELGKYKADFECVFADRKIRNIAVSGPYGSGKSTVVDSWEERRGGK